MALKLLRAQKLSSKLALSLILFGLGYIVVFFVLFLAYELPKIENEVEKEIDNMLETFVKPGAQAVYNLDGETAQTVLLGMNQYPYVKHAIINNEYQTHLAEMTFNPDQSKRFVLLMDLLDIPITKDYYRKLHDERFDEGVHGGLVVTVDSRLALAPAFEKLQGMLVANLIQNLSFVFIVYWIVYWLVGSRLSAIHSALSEIEPKSPGKKRVPTFANHDEITMLASGINQFISAAEEYLDEKNEAERGLLQLAQHLESVIKERTADLELQKTNAVKARDEATKANHAKSIFLSNMSHELRTPLNAILGFTRRVIKKSAQKFNEREKEALERILDNGQYLLNLVNDLLDIAKIEANKMTLDIEQVSLTDKISKCCDQLSSLAESKKIALEILIDKDVVVEADKQKIEQVIINLLSNAIKYTNEGWVKISLKSLPEHVEIWVEDSGVGIDEKDFEKIFDPYNHIHSDLNQAVTLESTGLGLPLVNKIVSLHQGSIKVNSTVGKGSCFKVTLPYSLSNYNDNQCMAS